jgi:hypothetical protein
LRLWRGEPQFRPVYFEMSVLDRYRIDPRYHFSFHDNGGQISVRDDFFRSGDFPTRDKVLMQTFGVGYDDNGGRVIAAFLWYVAALTAEHQRIWEAFERRDHCVMNPDYFRSAMGEWPTHGSIYTAFLMEQVAINEMSEAIGRPRLLHHTFEHGRPTGFHVFFTPTLRNFHAFTMELDKLMSQNINRAFFEGEVTTTRTVARRDGSVVEHQRGSIEQLEDWLQTYFRTGDADAIQTVVQPLRRVRRERQTPAHQFAEDRFDPAYWTQQDELMTQSYRSMRTLRLILANYPGAEGVSVPEWVQEGRIRPR